MNNKAQFYLIAALVIISLISGAVGVYNSAKSPQKETFFYSLQEEAEYEAGQIVNNGVYRELEPWQISENLQSLAKYYYSSNPNTDILLATAIGENSLNFTLYKNLAEGNMGINYSNVELFPQNNLKGISSIIKGRNGDSLIVLIDGGINKEFKLRNDENYFLFVLREGKEGELFLQPPVSKDPLDKILKRV